MARPPFAPPGADAAVYVISVAAELTGLHPQTLRTYERLGLITPGRTGGGGRRYSSRDIELLREIADLTGAGIGLEGVRRILDLENRVAALASRNEELREELALTREALQQATRTAQAGQGAPGGPRSTPGYPGTLPAAPPNRLPVLRPQPAEQSLVVWRRRRLL